MVLLLLAFVGQVVSAPLFAISDCQMEKPSHSMPNHDMASMDMGADMDCCEDECDCPIQMCLSVIVYSNQDNGIQKPLASGYSFPLILFTISHHPSSIYHPPILS